MIEYFLISLLIAFVLLIFLKTRKQEKERQEQEAYKKIDTLGGTEHIKQQLKTKSAEEIAKKHNLTLESLNRYCQEHDTTIDKLINEIQRDFAAERERLHKEQERQRQQQEHERKIQEAYKKIDTLGGTEHIKQQLKTKSAEEIAQIVNITTENLNQYCQKHGTSINQLQKEIEQERKILEAYEKIDTQGGTEHIKQQLKTKSADKIAKEYDITSSQLNKYCQKHNTTIYKLRKENQKEKEEEAYRKINKFGGTEHIKQQLKTKSAKRIAEEYDITASQLNKYCQKHNTTIDKLLKENKKEKVEEAYKKIDTLGGTEHIKQQLKTKSAKRIAEKYDITSSQLNKYCQKHGTTIYQLKDELIKEKGRSNKVNNYSYIKERLKKDKKQYSGDNYNKDLFS